VRSLADDGVLAGERGAYRLVMAPETVHVPATVQAILAARIDRLPPEDKTLLQTASVVGTAVPVTVLAAVSGVSTDTLADRVARIQAAEFLYETSLFPDAEYTFKHALTHEVAYGSLLQDRRRELHTRTVETIERLYPERLGEHVERLAHHAVRGEAWEKAIPYLRQSGARAMERSATGEAVRFFEMLVLAVERQRDTVDASLKLDAYLELYTARFENSEERGIQAVVARIEELARLVGDGSGLARVRLQQAQTAWNLPDAPDGADTAIRLAQHALDLARSEDLRTRSYALFLSASSHRNRGRFGEAIQQFEHGLSLFSTAERKHEGPSMTWPIYVSLSSWGAETHAVLGKFNRAIEWGRRGEQVADEIGNAGSSVLLLHSWATCTS
jgi:tetratricopeptide (TPR) repeat protein